MKTWKEANDTYEECSEEKLIHFSGIQGSTSHRPDKPALLRRENAKWKNTKLCRQKGPAGAQYGISFDGFYWVWHWDFIWHL